MSTDNPSNGSPSSAPGYDPKAALDEQTAAARAVLMRQKIIHDDIANWGILNAVAQNALLSARTAGLGEGSVIPFGSVTQNFITQAPQSDSHAVSAQPTPASPATPTPTPTPGPGTQPSVPSTPNQPKPSPTATAAAWITKSLIGGAAALGISAGTLGIADYFGYIARQKAEPEYEWILQVERNNEFSGSVTAGAIDSRSVVGPGTSGNSQGTGGGTGTPGNP